MDQIPYLKELLLNLPTSLPCPPPELSDFYDLVDFTLDPNVLERVGGDEVKAVAETLSVRFIADQEFLLEERGPAVCAVVDIFLKYFEKYPGNRILGNWVRRIISGVESIYDEKKEPVSSILILVSQLIVFPRFQMLPLDPQGHQ